MMLHIRYKENTHSAPSAAFIGGDDPLAWLKEIDRWNISIGELECYLMPTSVQTIEAAGLFVIFKEPTKAKQIDLKNPYTSIEQKLFIPCNAEIVPQISKKELAAILLWTRQVFHPVIGLVGFEASDQVDLGSILSIENSIGSDWSFAHPGFAGRPRFNEIKVLQPTTQELINSIKEQIGQQPLENIPRVADEPSSSLQKVSDIIKFGLFKTLFGITQVLSSAIPEGNVRSSANNGEGLLQKFQKWMMQNLDELQKKRDSEIKRLLNLFDENTIEALQYAIPLNSPYLNRGSETVSSRLTRRSLAFNLRQLRGGSVTDSWDIGDHYHDLRTKYLAAAQSELARKDFKTAAYVYAHLLGDYHSAANALEQGKMFREAAMLYKDDLKNILAAAECLERGGLYLEAIELNKEINREERIGDLYMLVNQQENAENYFEKHIETRLLHNDHLDAARVIDDKLHQGERAQQVLLDGWNNSNQSELCLKKYFDLVLDKQPAATCVKMKNIFVKDTPRHKRIPLLNVLEYINKKQKNEVVLETTREIAYEIVHEETKKGNIHALDNLKRFFTEDRLIESDASRYKSSNRVKEVNPAGPEALHLDQSIKWIKAVWHRNQFLTIGIKNSCIHLARGNWYGNFEYYSWATTFKSGTHFSFINAPYKSNHVLLHASDGLPVTRKNLPRNKYFTDSIVVYCPVWLHKVSAQCALTSDDQVCRLDVSNGEMTIHQYSLDGNLQKSIGCFFEKESPLLENVYPNSILVYNDGVYYTAWENYFVTVSDAGAAKAFVFDTTIRFFTASSSFADFRLVVSTNKGCLLFKPENGLLNMQGGFFAEQLIPSSIWFVNTDMFVILEKMKATLFEVKEETITLTQTYNSHSNIIAAVPTNSRHQFALLEESGKISFCRIDG